MAKKRKKQIQKENTQRTLWIVISFLSAFLLFVTISRMGILGSTMNNVFTFLFGSLFLVPLITLFAYAIYDLFFYEKYPVSVSVMVGIVIFNVLILLLSGFIAEETSLFAEIMPYIKNAWSNVLKGIELPFTGGIIGNSLYTLSCEMVSRTGTIIIMVVFFIIFMVLVIPFETYKGVYDNTRTKVDEKKKEIRQAKLEAKEQALREEEERRHRLAEEMAALNEQEEAKRRESEAMKEEAKAEPVPVKKKPSHPEVLSKKSKYFINLEEEEINATKDEKPINKEIVVGDAIKAAPKVHKVTRNNGTYHLPKPYEQFLDSVNSSSSKINKTSAEVKGEKVIEILNNFEIKASLLNTYIGPSVTKFEIKPDSSVKINKIMNISDNIKMELAARDIRIEAPIPGRSAVGIEIPNVETVPVRMLDLMKGIPADKRSNPLLFALGKDLMGKPVYCDVVKMPHLLIAGATGSGKSVCINSIIISFLMRTNPDSVKLVLVDPKKVEFTPYNDIPHLLWPIITDPQMASNMLKKLVVMMEERYEAFAEVGVRNIEGFNQFVDEHNRNLKEDESPMNRLPFIVVIIDELADLMMIAGKDVEASIQRITQLARASGIHLIVATQRPSTDVITGLIKSNIPSRISFAVSSSIDSRTILDQTGAERLLGNGDMLYSPQGENSPIRLQGVYVTDQEIKKVTTFVKEQAKPEYEDSYFEFLTNMNGSVMSGASSVSADSQDSLYDDVVEYIKQSQKASTSVLQRRFGIGYSRAARLIDTLEDRGLIGPANGSKPREVYIKNEEE